LDAPDRKTTQGARDYALLLFFTIPARVPMKRRDSRFVT
jgi:hypothetical protein